MAGLVPAPHVMAGLVPAISTGRVPLPMAGTVPRDKPGDMGRPSRRMHAPRNPAQCLRHELRRPHPARDVGAPARPLDALYRPRPLGVAGADIGTRAVRRAV